MSSNPSIPCRSLSIDNNFNIVDKANNIIIPASIFTSNNDTPHHLSCSSSLLAVSATKSAGQNQIYIFDINNDYTNDPYLPLGIGSVGDTWAGMACCGCSGVSILLQKGGSGEVYSLYFVTVGGQEINQDITFVSGDANPVLSCCNSIVSIVTENLTDTNNITKNIYIAYVGGEEITVDFGLFTHPNFIASACCENMGVVFITHTEGSFYFNFVTSSGAALPIEITQFVEGNYPQSLICCGDNIVVQTFNSETNQNALYVFSLSEGTTIDLVSFIPNPILIGATTDTFQGMVCILDGVIAALFQTESQAYTIASISSSTGLYTPLTCENVCCAVKELGDFLPTNSINEIAILLMTESEATNSLSEGGFGCSCDAAAQALFNAFSSITVSCLFSALYGAGCDCEEAAHAIANLSCHPFGASENFLADLAEAMRASGQCNCAQIAVTLWNLPEGSDGTVTDPKQFMADIALALTQAHTTDSTLECSCDDLVDAVMAIAYSVNTTPETGCELAGAIAYALNSVGCGVEYIAKALGTEGLNCPCCVIVDALNCVGLLTSDSTIATEMIEDIIQILGMAGADCSCGDVLVALYQHEQNIVSQLCLTEVVTLVSTYTQSCSCEELLRGLLKLLEQGLILPNDHYTVNGDSQALLNDLVLLLQNDMSTNTSTTYGCSCLEIMTVLWPTCVFPEGLTDIQKAAYFVTAFFNNVDGTIAPYCDCAELAQAFASLRVGECNPLGMGQTLANNIANVLKENSGESCERCDCSAIAHALGEVVIDGCKIFKFNTVILALLQIGCSACEILRAISDKTGVFTSDEHGVYLDDSTLLFTCSAISSVCGTKENYIVLVETNNNQSLEPGSVYGAYEIFAFDDSGNLSFECVLSGTFSNFDVSLNMQFQCCYRQLSFQNCNGYSILSFPNGQVSEAAGQFCPNQEMVGMICCDAISTANEVPAYVIIKNNVEGGNGFFSIAGTTLAFGSADDKFVSTYKCQDQFFVLLNSICGNHYSLYAFDITGCTIAQKFTSFKQTTIGCTNNLVFANSVLLTGFDHNYLMVFDTIKGFVLDCGGCHPQPTFNLPSNCFQNYATGQVVEALVSGENIIIAVNRDVNHQLWLYTFNAAGSANPQFGFPVGGEGDHLVKVQYCGGDSSKITVILKNKTTGKFSYLAYDLFGAVTSVPCCADCCFPARCQFNSDQEYYTFLAQVGCNTTDVLHAWWGGCTNITLCDFNGDCVNEAVIIQQSNNQHTFTVLKENGVCGPMLLGTCVDTFKGACYVDLNNDGKFEVLIILSSEWNPNQLYMLNEVGQLETLYPESVICCGQSIFFVLNHRLYGFALGEGNTLTFSFVTPVGCADDKLITLKCASEGCNIHHLVIVLRNQSNGKFTFVTYNTLGMVTSNPDCSESCFPARCQFSSDPEYYQFLLQVGCTDQNTVSHWLNPESDPCTYIFLCDLNGDCINEVITIHTTDDQNTFTVLKEKSECGPRSLGTCNDIFKGACCVDLNNDGKSELLIVLSSEAQLNQLFMLNEMGQLETLYPTSITCCGQAIFFVLNHRLYGFALGEGNSLTFSFVKPLGTVDDKLVSMKCASEGCNIHHLVIVLRNQSTGDFTFVTYNTQGCIIENPCCTEGCFPARCQFSSDHEYYQFLVQVGCANEDAIKRWLNPDNSNSIYIFLCDLNGDCVKEIVVVSCSEGQHYYSVIGACHMYANQPLGSTGDTFKGGFCCDLDHSGHNKLILILGNNNNPLMPFALNEEGRLETLHPQSIIACCTKYAVVLERQNQIWLYVFNGDNNSNYDSNVELVFDTPIGSLQDQFIALKCCQEDSTTISVVLKTKSCGGFTFLTYTLDGQLTDNPSCNDACFPQREDFECASDYFQFLTYTHCHHDYTGQHHDHTDHNDWTSTDYNYDDNVIECDLNADGLEERMTISCNHNGQHYLFLPTRERDYSLVIGAAGDRFLGSFCCDINQDGRNELVIILSGNPDAVQFVVVDYKGNLSMLTPVSLLTCCDKLIVVLESHINNRCEISYFVLQSIQRRYELVVSMRYLRFLKDCSLKAAQCCDDNFILLLKSDQCDTLYFIDLITGVVKKSTQVSNYYNSFCCKCTVDEQWNFFVIDTQQNITIYNEEGCQRTPTILVKDVVGTASNCVNGTKFIIVYQDGDNELTLVLNQDGSVLHCPQLPLCGTYKESLICGNSLIIFSTSTNESSLYFRGFDICTGESSFSVQSIGNAPQDTVMGIWCSNGKVLVSLHDDAGFHIYTIDPSTGATINVALANNVTGSLVLSSTTDEPDTVHYYSANGQYYFLAVDSNGQIIFGPIVIDSTADSIISVSIQRNKLVIVLRAGNTNKQKWYIINAQGDITVDGVIVGDNIRSRNIIRLWLRQP